MIDVNKLISEAMKSRNKEELEVYKLIKAEFVKAEKDGVVLDDISQAKILLKMCSQREDSIAQYVAGNRKDLAAIESYELGIIKNLMPDQPTDEEIENYTRQAITAYKVTNSDPISMKDMKPLLQIVQSKYPSANGKIVSKVLQSVLKGK